MHAEVIEWPFHVDDSLCQLQHVTPRPSRPTRASLIVSPNHYNAVLVPLFLPRQYSLGARPCWQQDHGRACACLQAAGRVLGRGPGD